MLRVLSANFVKIKIKSLPGLQNICGRLQGARLLRLYGATLPNPDRNIINYYTIYGSTDKQERTSFIKQRYRYLKEHFPMQNKNKRSYLRLETFNWFTVLLSDKGSHGNSFRCLKNSHAKFHKGSHHHSHHPPHISLLIDFFP